MKNLKKQLWALYAIGTSLGASFVSGCCSNGYATCPTCRNTPSSAVSGTMDGIARGLIMLR